VAGAEPSFSDNLRPPLIRSGTASHAFTPESEEEVRCLSAARMLRLRGTDLYACCVACKQGVCLYSLIVTSQLELAKGDAVEVEGEEIEGWLQVCCCLCSSCMQQLQASCLAQPPRSAVLHVSTLLTSQSGAFLLWMSMQVTKLSDGSRGLVPGWAVDVS
jgi:hypothetical protein